MSETVDKVNSKSLAPAGEIFDLLHALMHLHRGRQPRETAAHDEAALTHMEARALGFIGRHAGATQTDLVLRSGRDKAQIARLIASLKARGLIEASADATDRRTQRLALTEAGQALHRRLRRHGEQVAQAAVRDFSQAELDQLLALLARLRANLEAAEE
ncbi:MarR family winged helix-turn-helix transcriptional regulator [Roseateles sp. DC23W]